MVVLVNLDQLVLSLGGSAKLIPQAPVKCLFSGVRCSDRHALAPFGPSSTALDEPGAEIRSVVLAAMA